MTSTCIDSAPTSLNNNTTKRGAPAKRITPILVVPGKTQNVSKVELAAQHDDSNAGNVVSKAQHDDEQGEKSKAKRRHHNNNNNKPSEPREEQTVEENSRHEEDMKEAEEELLDEDGEDPDPVHINPTDLANSENMEKIYNQVKERNCRQIEKRRDKMEKLFRALNNTDGTKPPQYFFYY